MRDLTKFLTARIAEDEQWALAAQDGDGYAEWDNPSTGVVQVAAGGMDGLVLVPRDMAVHIARHDPARELREVEAKRRIMEIHNAKDSWGMCLGCPRDRNGNMVVEVDECPELRALALPYADHPEYKESWRP